MTTSRDSITFHTRSCPLCDSTFRARTTLDLLNRVLEHLEKDSHPGRNVAQALNEVAFQINSLETAQARAESMKVQYIRDSNAAFLNAAALGFLNSHDPQAPNRMDLFMYMYSIGQQDYFKHRDTRRYVIIPFE